MKEYRTRLFFAALDGWLIHSGITGIIDAHWWRIILLVWGGGSLVYAMIKGNPQA